MGLIYVLLGSFLNRGAVHNLPFFISFILLFVILLVNMSIMVGAIKIKSVANDTLTTIEQINNLNQSVDISELGNSISNGNILEIIQQIGKYTDDVDMSQVQELKVNLRNNWDLLNTYFEHNDVSTVALFLSPKRTIEKFNSKMNSIIIKNIVWSTLFIILTIVIALYNFKIAGKQSRKRTQYNYRHTLNDEDF